MYLYAILISFIIVFVSELGDKTQLLMLSFSKKAKCFPILIGVAIGSFFSHGLAILFGSSLTFFENNLSQDILEMFTYISFILVGIISFIPKKEVLTMENTKKEGILVKISNLKLNYSFLIALYIIVGEIGDKTFLSSIGLGIQYPNYKISLIFGAILGMVLSDSIALFFGKFLNRHLSEDKMKKLSGILFIIFGVLGIIFH